MLDTRGRVSDSDVHCRRGPTNSGRGPPKPVYNFESATDQGGAVLAACIGGFRTGVGFRNFCIQQRRSKTQDLAQGEDTYLVSF